MVMCLETSLHPGGIALAETRHAYLVFAHQNPAQLETLLRLIDHPQNDIFLHLDPLAHDFNRARLQATVRQGTLRVYSIQHCGWGSETLIDGILALLAEASQTEHLYYHLLSGMDLPLRPQAEIQAFFEAEPGREWIDFGAETISPALLADRLKTYHLFQNRREIDPILKPLDRALLRAQSLFGVDRLKGSGMTFQKGSLWFSVTHGFSRYCVEHANEYRRYFRFSKCGDELFFQTLLLHSPFFQNRAVSTYNDDRATMRFIDWDSGDGSSPYVFRSEDFERIMLSGMLFARKFDESVDEGVIARISEVVLGQSV